MTTGEEKYFLTNKTNWDNRVPIHRDSSFYDIQSFKNGKNSLNHIEISELGNVKGKTVLHLQCHFGLDSLSWSRLGAKVTGIDFSEKAIDLANQLNAELDMDATFVCCNVYDLEQCLNAKYDIVFTSYGVIGWLPDLQRWAKIISHFLKPGGTFYMAEFHPYVWMFDDNFTRIEYSYFNVGVIETDNENTYANRTEEFNHKEYSWNHPISDVVNALIGAGLNISMLHEYDYSPYDCFKNMVKKEDGKFYISGMENKLPMIYSIKASKPE